MVIICQFIQVSNHYVYLCEPLSGGSVVKNPPGNTGDTGLIPESGRFSGGGNGNPLQCSCLGNPRGAWWTRIHGVEKESDSTLTTKQYIVCVSFSYSFVCICFSCDYECHIIHHLTRIFLLRCFHFKSFI